MATDILCTTVLEGTHVTEKIELLQKKKKKIEICGFHKSTKQIWLQPSESRIKMASAVKLLICWTCIWGLGYSQYNVYRQDPFAILSRTLLTYQQAACDGQVLNLICPTSTKISIQLVQYGRTAPSSQVSPYCH